MAFTVQAYYLTGNTPNYDFLFLFNGLSTLFVYLLIRVAATKRIEEYKPDERWNFFFENLTFIKTLTVIAGASCVVIYFFLEKQVQYALVLPGIISIVYGIPFRVSKKRKRLRDVGIVKIFLISFVWAYTGSVLPILNAGDSIWTVECVLLFAAGFCFIFGITLPFDIKDMQIDAMHGVKTIPVYLGEENTYTLAFLLLFISGGIHIVMQSMYNNINYSVPLGISMLVTGLTVYLTRIKKGNFLFFGLLDGMILLQFLLIRFYRY